MERVILHVDSNSYYAAIECLYNPDIRDLPVAVCGDPEARHGIVLTKNQIAKRFDIKTGEAIFQAKQKCPKLVVVPPDYDLYWRFTKRMRSLFSEYSDRVEPYGLDEAWVDVSAPGLDVEGGGKIADQLRNRIRTELGITVSIGVSFNKVFAKLGSDMKKPDATTVISEANYKQLVWPLPVSDLLFVGRKIAEKLKDRRICTIGDLAHADDEMLSCRLGKVGLMLKSYAAGFDTSPVKPDNLGEPVQSVGHSSTPPHDIETLHHAKCLFYLLAESVGTRLRGYGFRSRCISISVRTTELACFSCQRTLPRATNLTGEIARMAIKLFEERYINQMPFRSIGLCCQSLVAEAAPEQLDLWGNHVEREKLLRLDRAIDGLKERFGPNTVHRGIVLADRRFARVQPEYHIRPAATYYRK